MWKRNIARLVEIYAYKKRIDLRGYGGATFKNEAKERGAEPDECYLIGKKITDYPEIVLEVVHNAPLLNKLDVYAPMGIAEVWVFREGKFTLYALDRASNVYVVKAQSGLLPGLDFEKVARHAVREDTLRALTDFEAELGG